MRPRLLKWMVCPLCRGDLQLKSEVIQRTRVSEEDRAVLAATMPLNDSLEIEADVLSGALTCDTCHVYYPIHNGVARMLVYPTRVAHEHARGHASWIAKNLSGFHLPNNEPPSGEASVLRNFSKEWTDYKWTGASYWTTTPEHMLTCKRYELGVARHPLTHKLVLELGIGIGGTADALSRAESCELVGVDLGDAVDQARRYFGANPRLHIVQASVFAPPFRSGTFDVVYSHGVLHHTFNTRVAFQHLATLPKPSGMLYIWVYSVAHTQSTARQRVLMMIERAVRPVLARLPSRLQTVCLLPTVPLYMLYQNVHRRRQLGADVTANYGLNEALHAARDRLTPPFAHRHTYDEVVEWFRSEFYDGLELLRDEQVPPGVPWTYPVHVGVRGFRQATAPAQQN